MNEPIKPTTKNPLPPIQARTVDFKKVYALLYRAYLRSQNSKIGNLSNEKEKKYE